MPRGVVVAVMMTTTVVLALRGRAADACSFSPKIHTLDPAEQAIDRQPPGTPTIASTKTQRGRGPELQGCGSSASSCDDVGTITIGVTSTDDRTAVERMGYRLTVVRGHAPPDLFPAGQDVGTFSGGFMYLKWLDGATDDQEDLNFDLEVRAIDLAGNVSAGAATVRVQDGTGGCLIAGRSPRSVVTTAFTLVAAITAAALTRRRRRRLDG